MALPAVDTAEIIQKPKEDRCVCDWETKEHKGKLTWVAFSKYRVSVYACENHLPIYLETGWYIVNIPTRVTEASLAEASAPEIPEDNSPARLSAERVL
jgi:hypothetical protein